MDNQVLPYASVPTPRTTGAQLPTWEPSELQLQAVSTGVPFMLR